MEKVTNGNKTGEGAKAEEALKLRMLEKQVVDDLGITESPCSKRLHEIKNNAGDKKLVTPRVAEYVEMLALSEHHFFGKEEKKLAIEAYAQILTKNPDFAEYKIYDFLKFLRESLREGAFYSEGYEHRTLGALEVISSSLDELKKSAEKFTDPDSRKMHSWDWDMRSGVFLCLGSPLLRVRGKAEEIIANKFGISNKTLREIPKEILSAPYSPDKWHPLTTLAWLNEYTYDTDATFSQIINNIKSTSLEFVYARTEDLSDLKATGSEKARYVGICCALYKEIEEQGAEGNPRWGEVLDEIFNKKVKKLVKEGASIKEVEGRLEEILAEMRTKRVEEFKTAAFQILE